MATCYLYQQLVTMIAISLGIVTVNCQLQQKCNGVNMQDSYSSAQLECTKTEFTVELNIKHASLSVIDGVRIDLSCNDGTIITVRYYYSSSSKETFISSFDAYTSAKIDSCVLFACYKHKYNYNSYNIHTTSNCSFVNSESSTTRKANTGSSLSSWKTTVTQQASFDVMEAYSISSYQLLPTVSSSPMINVAMTQLSTSRITATLDIANSSVLTLITDSSSRIIAINSHSSILNTQAKPLQSLSSIAFTDSYHVPIPSIPAVTHIHATTTLSNAHQNTNKVETTTRAELVLSSLEPRSSAPETVSVITIVSSALAVCVVVMIALVSCSVFLLKHYKVSTLQKKQLVEDELGNGQMNVEIDKDNLEFSSSMVTIVSPLEQAPDDADPIDQVRPWPTESNSCPTQTTYPTGSNMEEIITANDIVMKLNIFDMTVRRKSDSDTPTSETSPSEVYVSHGLRPSNDTTNGNNTCNVVPLQVLTHLESSIRNNQGDKQNLKEIRTNSSKPCKFCTDQKTYLHCYHSFID